jgi:uncharacterized phage-associated protein
MTSAPLYNEQVAAEVAAYFLHSAGGILPVIKLVKLMYLAERLSLERYGEPLTGDRLVSMDHGPVLSITYNHMTGALQSADGGWDSWVADREEHMVSLVDPSKIRSPGQDLLHLSESDLEVLQEIWEHFGHWDRWRLRDYTHDHCPEWQNPHGSSKPIEYEQLFEALDLSADQVASRLGHLKEQEQINRLLST